MKHAWVAALALAAASAAEAGPFLTRNQSPIVDLYGLPSPLPARLPATGHSRIAGVVNWSNSAYTDTTDTQSSTVDGEVFEVRAVYDRGFSERLAFHGELAWRNLSAGVLDSTIEQWHKIFGLPNGMRDRLPDDELLIEYRAGDTTLLHLDEPVSGIADIPLSLGYQLSATEQRAFAAWLTVKAPVGSADDFTGSGAVDVAATIAAEAQLAARWQLFGQANVAWLGQGDLLPELQEDYAYSAMAGITWNAWRSLDLTAQVETNSKVLDAGGGFFEGDAVILVFGGSYRTQGGWQFDVGVTEDIDVDASPDVTFNFAARRGF